VSSHLAAFGALVASIIGWALFGAWLGVEMCRWAA